MDIYKVLTLLEKLEGDFSGLYKQLHEEYRLNKEAARFFYTCILRRRPIARSCAWSGG